MCVQLSQYDFLCENAKQGVHALGQKGTNFEVLRYFPTFKVQTCVVLISITRVVVIVLKVHGYLALFS